MTEVNNGMSQSQDVSSSQPVQSAPAPQSAPESARPVEQHAERTFRQSEVTDIVKRTKQEALDSYKRMQTEQPQYLQQKFGETQNNGQNQSPNREANYNNSGDNDSRMRQVASEEAQRLRDEWMQSSRQEAEQANAQRTVNEFWNKISTGKEKYQDFEQVTGDIEIARFPNVVQLLAGYVDNAEGILYEFGKDRIKMANLESLAERSPKDAIAQVQRLAKSIKENHDAANIKLPNQPLSQMRPSNAGTDNGAMSVTDFRKKYKV